MLHTHLPQFYPRADSFDEGMPANTVPRFHTHLPHFHLFADSFDKGVLANTNVGGENCHRGSALGALMGAGLGESRIPRRLIDGLHDSAAIRGEIDAYVGALFTEAK